MYLLHLLKSSKNPALQQLKTYMEKTTAPERLAGLRAFRGEVKIKICFLLNLPYLGVLYLITHLEV